MKLEIDVSEEAYEAYQTLADAMGKENFDKALGSGIINSIKSALKPKDEPVVKTDTPLMQLHRNLMNSMAPVPMPSLVVSQMCNAYNSYYPCYGATENLAGQRERVFDICVRG